MKKVYFTEWSNPTWTKVVGYWADAEGHIISDKPAVIRLIPTHSIRG